MPDSKQKQITQEQSSWLRSLEYIRQENVFLKTRLAEIIKNDEYKHLLNKAEYFNSLFLDKDAVITLLRRDIAAHMMNTMNEATFKNGLLKEQEKLRADILNMEREFSLAKQEFNNFVQSDL